MPEIANAISPHAEPLLELRHLQVELRADGAWRPIVKGINLSIGAGRVLTLLGESGSGKSVTLRAIVSLLPSDSSRIGGQILLGGADLAAMPLAQRVRARGRDIGFIFQEPMTALDPVFRVGDQIAEMLVRHKGMSYGQALVRTKDLFDLVQIPSAERRLRAWPFELSGGLRQRVMIAMAISCEPRLLLADEPTTALDATVQIQVMTLLRDIRRQFGMSILFVTHDLGVAAGISDDVAVMYRGQIVESGLAEQVLLDPQHEYTRHLTASQVSGHYRHNRLGALA